LQDVKKDLFLGGDEIVSDFKNQKNATSTMTKSSLMTTKAAAAAKKKAGKFYHFGSKFVKLLFLYHTVCFCQSSLYAFSPFLPFFDKQCRIRT
jgi:hypothetical protein